MKEIPLEGSNSVALVDDDDYERLMHFRWQLVGEYARKCTGRGVFMHEEVLGLIKGLEIHHRNENKLDYRKENLCHVTKTQHNQLRRKGKSGFIGVYYLPKRASSKKWVAQVRNKGVFRQVGFFLTAEEAARERDKEAIRQFGLEAILNFPLFEELSPRTLAIVIAKQENKELK